MSYRYATVLSRRSARALLTPSILFLFSVFLLATTLILVFLLNIVQETHSEHRQHFPQFEQPPSWVWKYVLNNPNTLDDQSTIGGSRIEQAKATEEKRTSKDSVGGILKLLVTVKSAPQNIERKE